MARGMNPVVFYSQNSVVRINWKPASLFNGVRYLTGDSLEYSYVGGGGRGGVERCLG